MNLDDLRRVQNRERASDALQELPSSFYVDVAVYIEELREERQRLADALDDPFGSPEVGRLTDEIETAERVAEAIYERRVGKVVKQASFAAADMGGGEDGLTEEEAALFEDLVSRIEGNKRRVLDVLAGETDLADESGDDATATAPPAPDAARSADGLAEETAASTDGVAAADAMGGPSPAESQSTAGGSGSEGERPSSGTAERPSPSGDGGRREDAPTGGEETRGSDPAANDADPKTDDADRERRTRVRLTRDVGEIFGVDERVYVLEADDVVELPATNAEPLIAREAAERLE